MKRGIAGTFCAALSAAALFTGAAIPAQASTTVWRVAFSAHYGVAANYSVYGTVVATSASNAWAFGGSDESYGNGTVQQVEGAHWTGSSWHTVTLPAGIGDFIVGASAPAANDIWAVTRHGYIMHYNGKTMSVAHRLPTGQQYLTGVLAFSPTNVWVYGNGGPSPGYGTYHFNGSSWTAQTGLAADISFASATSASDIWAIDGVNSPQDAIVHYTGKGWGTVSSHSMSGLTFWTIKAVSAKSVWIAATLPGDNFQSYVFHYNGTGISKATVPYSVRVISVAPDGDGGLWMLGNDSSNQCYAIHVVNGVWSRVPIGSTTSLTSIPGTTAEWAPGTRRTSTGAQAIIWAYGRP